MSLPLQLRVELDAGSGFCFGVVYAIELAEEVLAERGYLYCLGDIVHNGVLLQKDTVGELVLSPCWRNQSLEKGLTRLG